ncbi:MAG: ThiF family adenylyltransferase [Pseudomonadota bacterium]
MILLHLNDALYVQPYDKQLIFHTPGNMQSISDNQEQVLEILQVIKSVGDAGQQVVYEEVLKSIDISKSDFDNMLEFLIEENIIKYDIENLNPLSSKSLEKFDRQIRSFATLAGNCKSDAYKFQHKIENAHIAVLGLGGVGSYVAYGLASMGIGKLSLIEFDNIELSNTSRQMLYQECDVGQSKIDIATGKLQLTNPETKILAHPKRVQSVDDLSPLLFGVDILILAADTPRGKIVYLAAEACQIVKCAFVYGMPLAHNIICGPLIIPGTTRSYDEIFPPIKDTEDKRIDYINSGFAATVIDPYNAIAAKTVVLECIKYISGFSPCRIVDHVLNINTDHWTLDIQKV